MRDRLKFKIVYPVNDTESVSIDLINDSEKKIILALMRVLENAADYEYISPRSIDTSFLDIPRVLFSIDEGEDEKLKIFSRLLDLKTKLIQLNDISDKELLIVAASLAIKRSNYIDTTIRIIDEALNTPADVLYLEYADASDSYADASNSFDNLVEIYLKEHSVQSLGVNILYGSFSFYDLGLYLKNNTNFTESIMHDTVKSLFNKLSITLTDDEISDAMHANSLAELAASFEKSSNISAEKLGMLLADIEYYRSKYNDRSNSEIGKLYIYNKYDDDLTLCDSEFLKRYIDYDRLNYELSNEYIVTSIAGLNAYVSFTMGVNDEI